MLDAGSECLPGDEHPYLRRFKSSVRWELLDCELSGFTFQNNHLISPRREVVYEPQIKFHELPVARQTLHSARRVHGTVAYLSNTMVAHFGHWMQYTLPLLRVYREWSPQLNIDAFYIGDGPLTSFQRETLRYAGISPSQILCEACRPDRLITAIPVRLCQNGAPFYLDQSSHRYVRELVLQHLPTAVSEKPRRLYVARGTVQWRRVLNEDEVITMLTKRGFTPVVMEGRTVAEQAQLFHECDAVVAPHGAALANTLFMREASRLIELFPYEFGETSAFTFAAYSRFRYAHLRGEPLNSAAPWPMAADMRINLEKLARLCDKMGL
jgi:capsular polysaccharide biosynthesis protein